PPSHESPDLRGRRYGRRRRRETGRATVFARRSHGPAPVASTDVGLPCVCQDRRVRLTVLIVDDHAEFRASASELLEAEGFDVTGAAAEAARARELALRL